QLQRLDLVGVVGGQVFLRDQAAVLLKGVGDAAGDRAAVERFDGVPFGQFLQQVGQVRVAVRTPGGERFAVFEKEAGRGGVRTELALRGAQGVRHAPTDREAFAGEADGRPDELAERAGAVAVEGELQAG